MTVTPSMLQTHSDLPASNTTLLAVQSGLQAMLDAVPVALLGFHVQGTELRLLSANAAARRLDGLRAVRSPGAAASKVFVLLAGTHLLEQLSAVARTGERRWNAAMCCASRAGWCWPGRSMRTARGIGSILVTVQDVSEAENLRSSTGVLGERAGRNPA